MPTFIALLRAVNVGGTGKLPMSDLKQLCESAGFANVQTYIASGNVVFDSAKKAPQIKKTLEDALLAYAGKPVQVCIRDAGELAQVLKDNPFPDAAPNRTMTIFLDNAPPANTLDEMRGKKDEEVQLGVREIYVSYGEGMGQSKLAIPAARDGTARNMNTVAKLVAIAAAR